MSLRGLLVAKTGVVEAQMPLTSAEVLLPRRLQQMIAILKKPEICV